jgi:hypothetical protein
MCALMPQILKAGELAPVDGLYRVTHYQHRLPHLVSVIGGTILPLCQKCGDRVHFEIIGPPRETDGLSTDRDFSDDSDGIKRSR